jgi:plasmid stabilization system protein ParE
VAELVFTSQVERDLTDIGDYIAQDNHRAAAEFVEAIRQHCSLLASSPFIGRSRPDIHPDVRAFPHGSYLVIYRYRAELDRAEVLRVWHGRRRLPSARDLRIPE